MAFFDINNLSPATNLLKKFGDLPGIRDFADALGIGSQRRSEDYNSAQAALDRDFQSAQAQAQRDWEERMSNTAHQREVADLKAAGLNPVLSVLGGNGASTPSGAVADGSRASSGIQSGSIAYAIPATINAASSLLRSTNNTSNDSNVVNAAVGLMKLLK